jgi:signal transduction histidine kinase
VALLGMAAGGLIIAVIWLGVVSRRQMAQRETDRRMAEAEFAAMLRERNRMARDIHDTLAQGLNAVSMQLELAKNNGEKNPAGAQQHLATAHRIVRTCIAEARESIWNMRAHVLERTDLSGALAEGLRQMSDGLPLEARIDVTGIPRRLAPQVENNLLRIGQEAISNAIKHAHAARLTLRLGFENELVCLKIEDNGCGFDVAASGRVASRFGLAGMRERAEQLPASLEIRSVPGEGTEVIITVVSPR